MFREVFKTSPILVQAEEDLLMLMKRSWFLALSLSTLLGCGATPQKSNLSDTASDYYASITGQTGEELHKALHELIKGHKVYSYNEVFDLLKVTDEDPNNPRNVILFYTGESRSKSLTGNVEDESSGEGGSHRPWNREHVWAKSQGFPSSSMAPYTDLHHLRPADVKLNSTRSNLNFAEAPEGTPIQTAPGNKVAHNKAFEPADEFKGDVARMILYMDVRYEGGNNEPDLVAANIEEIDRSENSKELAKFGNLKDLLQWHKLDPVDDMERSRNEKIFKLQNNRNPFIDHPELVEKIWGQAG